LGDGTLEFHGRIDGPIKLRGFRIELGEIEAAMQKHSSVRQACVLPEQMAGRVTRLIGFCIPENAASFSEAVLRQHLQNALPPYMIPASMIVVDAFPLNVNGKIDRAKLMSLEKVKQTSKEYVAPATADEKTLCAIVAEVLTLPKIGVTDNLFELGVDSLKIFQITSHAQKAGVALTPRIVLQARTVRDALVEAAKSKEPATLSFVEIKPVARQRQRLGDGTSKRAS
jgi:aryl carrier-like protein